MGQQTQQESISRYAYIFVVLIAVIQAIAVWLFTDYSVGIESQLSAKFVYMLLLLAVFVPSAVSYLVTHAKSLAFYVNILIVTLLTIWISYWHARHSESSSDASTFVAFATLTVLFFFLLPWMQIRQNLGTWKVDYSCLMGFYIKNTALGIIAAAIGGAVVTIIYLAGFLFKIVNLNDLSSALNFPLTLWAGFFLGFNVSLVFLRSIFDLQPGKFIRYIARFFLLVLNIIAIIFIAGFILSKVTGLDAIGLGSFVMLWFLILNIVLINLVYGDGNSEQPFRSWLNSLVLFCIVLLNFFSLLSLYAILLRINQYSWTVDRLYAFTIALFLAVVVLAYSVAIIFKRKQWVYSLGSINKAGLLLLITIILAINSPIADFQRITLNSILSGIEKGKVKINNSLTYTLQSLGPEGKQALTKLKLTPEYKKAFDVSDNNEQQRKTLKQVLTLAQNSAELPESWWAKKDKYNEWYCTSYSESYKCVGFMADVNNDGKYEVVMCYSSPQNNALECIIWQEKDNHWQVIDTQNNQFDTEEKRDHVWQQLLEGQFNLKQKEWRQIVPK